MGDASSRDGGYREITGLSCFGLGRIVVNGICLDWQRSRTGGH